MEPKSLPPSKINPTKLLPGSGVSAITRKISFKSLVSEDKSISSTNLGVIKTQVIKINDLIKTNTLLKQAEETRKRKLAEKKKFSEKEEKLEAKPEKEDDKKIKLPGVPKLSFLDRIKKFLFNIFLGFIVVRLLPQLPKLMGVVKLAGQALDFVTDWGGKLLNGLVTFIDWGYKAYDNTKLFLKNLGGDNTVKVFDAFNGAIGKVIEASIIAALAFGDLSGDSETSAVGKPKKGFDTKGRRVTKTTQRRYFERYGRNQFIERFGKENLENLPKSSQRGVFSQFGRNAFVDIFGKSGAKTILKFVRPFTKRLPIIGGLLDFGLSVALGESLGRAAFKSTGAVIGGALGGTLGSAIPFFGTIVGGIAGGSIGDWLGGLLYDTFFGKKTPQKQKVQGRAQGGVITRGGRPTGFSAKRQVKKSKVKREVSITPSELKPGVDIGGEKKIEKIFPRSYKSDTINPLGYAEDFYDKTSEIPFFGPIFSLSTKVLLGNRPSSLDYENVGKGLNSWMSNTFSSEVLRTGGAFAGGGEVNTQMFMRGEDLSKVISKSVEETVSSRVDNVLNDLMKQLGLKEIDRGKEPGETGPGAEDEPSGSPTLTGNTNAEKVFRYLVDKEGFTPEAAAGVIGNLMQESGVNPNSRQLGGGPGRGIMQWTESERWASLSAWAKNSGKNPWALETQVEWMIKEMKSYGTYDRIKGVSSYKKAVEIFEKEMERAGTPNYPRRYQFAADALASFSSGAGGGAGGGYTQLSNNPDARRGSKLAGELGRFLDAKGLGRWGSGVHQHPEHPPWNPESGHSPGSLHYASKGSRAIDIGGYGRSRGYTDQDQILAGIAEFNKLKGVKPVQLLKDGYPGHDNHVHVAYGSGGLVRGFTRAILGERGIEFVLDTDTTSALEQNFPGFLDALNKANYEGAIQVLRDYASYERGFPMEVVVEQPEPEIVMVPMPTSQQSVISSSIESRSDSWRDYSYMQG